MMSTRPLPNDFGLEVLEQMCPITGKPFIANLDTLLQQITWQVVKKELPSTFSRQWLPCWDYNLENKIQGARKVIIILMLMAKIEAIENLLLEGLTDGDLPLSEYGANLQSRCKKKIFAALKPGGVSLFLEKQWMVVEPAFELNAPTASNLRLSQNVALRLTVSSCHEVTKPGPVTTRVYKITLKPGCQPEWDDSVEGGKSSPTCFALKIFQRHPSKPTVGYTEEKAILDMIEDLRISNEHLVRHLAFCDEAQCFIFPWADGGDLGDFWQRECPRKLEDFLWSLKQMVGLAHALEDLHKLGDCRHGDLKPANILHFTEGGVGILKIADFGVSKVHHTKTTARNSATITSAFSRGYEGPEASTVYKDQNPAEPRSRRYDCWSMGCIILEFVIWLLYDFRALDSFGQFRDSPDPTYYHIASDTTIKNAVPQRILVVHPEVSKAMKCLRDDKRCKDKALESLVKLVGDNLLKISYKQRLESAELHEKLQVMLDKVKKNPSDLVNLGIGPPNPRPKIFDQPLSLRPTTKSTYDPSSSSEED